MTQIDICDLAGHAWLIKSKSPEPLECDILSSPWSSLSLDNFEYKGTLYLIIYDRFSRFIVIKMPKDLSARSTIMCLLEVFCEHGVPSFIHTDRGRNFVSKDFNKFCQDLGIQLNFPVGTIIVPIKLRELYIQ